MTDRQARLPNNPRNQVINTDYASGIYIAITILVNEGQGDKMAKKLIVIGNGMAGTAAIENLLKAGSDLDITVFGEEPCGNYNRILLSDIISGKTDAEGIMLNTPEWYEQNGIRLFLNKKVTHIDLNNRMVEGMFFDYLLLATGSLPYLPPIRGLDKKGVFTYRNLKDVREILDYAVHVNKAMVIGGGLLGLEAARSLTSLGLEVKVAHLMGRLMEQQLDGFASNILVRAMERMGVRILLEHAAEEILGDEKAEGIRFSNRKIYSADLIVVAAGIRPNIEVALNSGLAVNRGILVNDYLETSHPNVFAIGECIEHRGRTCGLLAPALSQARIAAKSIAGDKSAPYVDTGVQTTLKVAGVNVVSMGNFLSDGAGLEEIVYSDAAAGIYKKIILQENRVSGAILVGDTALSGKLLSLMKSGADVSLFRSALLSDGRDKAGLQAAMTADTDIICGCAGVTKGEIISAIQEHELTSRQAVAEKTGAYSGCKGCGPMIDQLIQDTLGGEYAAGPKVSYFCSCTDITQEALAAAIFEKRLVSYTMVREAGLVKDCGICKPAVSYLVSRIWPLDFVEEKKARFINDRVHANIQKDGTFSVVPRIYGGVISPGQLRLIADVAEKYNAQMIKITGGQRIGLLGVRKEDLPDIWADLDMPSGHAYAKAVRTVKTCVGSAFCRFGTGDSISLGTELEKRLEGLYTPHKVKLAVTGCPRNCAEAYVKDIGIVAIEGGWEVYAGGAAGTKVRKGDLLCRVKTSEEAIEAATLFLQYYRENSAYMERTCDLVERLGIDNILSEINDMEKRQTLFEHFSIAKKAVSDPWSQEVRDPRQGGRFAGLAVSVYE